MILKLDRTTNRKAIESHELFPFVTLVEGSSTAPDIISYVKSLIKLREIVLVIQASCHTKHHVLDELNAYQDLVTAGSYIAITDGFIKKSMMYHGKIQNEFGIT